VPDLSATQLAALGTELSTDPKALGYSGLQNQAAADKLNQVGASSETVNPGTLQSYLIVDAIVSSEWTVLSQANKDLLNFYLQQPTVDTTSSNVRSAIGGIFAAGATRTALLALVNRPASRGEVLFGPGTVITKSNVGQARGTAT
jgi:hypothetical protein